MSTQHRRGRIAAAAVLAILISAMSGGIASATAPDEELTPADVRSQFTDTQLYLDPSVADSAAEAGSGGTIELRTAAYTVTCTPVAEAPHVSSTGGLGVIFKTRVTCSGTGSYPSPVTIRVRGGLFFDAAAYDGEDSNVSFAQVKTSDENRIVAVNGTQYTFYTPQVGTRGYTGTGHYQGTSTVELLTPVGQTVGASTSVIKWWNP